MKLHIEQLEPRLAMTASVVGSNIVVIGTVFPDVILFTKAGPNIQVIDNGVVSTFVATGHLIVYGGDGGDTITNVNVIRPVNFYGENGNDVLTGGPGDDRIYGGAGNDTIFGKAGSDMLAGNYGNDQLFGGNSSDILLGGSGADYARGENGDDIGNMEEFTLVSVWGTWEIIGNDNSLAFGDTNDRAMELLLADWADDRRQQTYLIMPNVSDDGFNDAWDKD